MKRLSKARKLIATLMMAAILCLIPGGHALKVSADKAITFSVRYIEDMGEWRYQANTSTFDDSKEHREIYYLRRALQAGDKVVVYGDSSKAGTLDLGSTPLSNLTVKETKSFISIFSGDVDECYILADAKCAINADIKTAYIYGASLSNFNDNVEVLWLKTDGDGLDCTVGCSGVVGHLYAETSNGKRTFYDLYDFDKDTLSIRYGVLETEKSHYSRSPKVEITRENFDYERYANDYPDLKAVFGYDATALYNHYINNGIKEKRAAYAVHVNDFDYKRYADDYPDLKKAFGYDEKALYTHYTTNGIKENRTAYDTSGRLFHY